MPTYDFRQLWDLGYRALVPIIPPAVQISEHSVLYSAVGANSDPRGKSPGVRGRDGKWTGLKDWLNHKTTERDLKAWEAMGAGVGMRAGPIDPTKPEENWLVFIDSDTLDAELAQQVDKLVHAHFGFLPCRIGRAPKALYPIRLSGPFRYARVMFGDIDSQTGRHKHAVEILAGMKQAVFGGVHPATGKPYQWVRALVPLNALTIIAPEQLTAFMADLAEKLPNATTAAKEAARGPLDRTKIDQDALKAPIDLVEQALAAIPNTMKDFPSYDDMTSIGYSIKGATQDDPDRGFDMFDRWVASWEGGGYDPGLVKKWWDSYVPPFQNGARELFKAATKFGPSRFSTALALFEDLTDGSPEAETKNSENLFGGASASADAAPPTPKINAKPYGWPAPASIPRRQWLYGRHLIRKFVSATVAPGGVGKSSLAIVEALAMISGRALLHGIQPPRPLNVWLWNGEDPMDELERRIAAASLYYGVEQDTCGGRLFVNSGRDTPIVVAETTRAGFTLFRPVLDAVIATVRENAIDCLVVDPFVSCHRVTENDNNGMDAVAKAWAAVADACNCAVELVIHSRKTGGEEVTSESARGASAQVAAARSVRALNRMTPDEATKAGVAAPGLFFRIDDSLGKANLSPPADKAEWFRLESVDLWNGGDAEPGDKVGVVAAWTWPVATDGLADGDLTNVQAAVADGVWRADPRSQDWVGRPVARALSLDLDDKKARERVKALVKEMVKTGALVVVERADDARRMREYVEVGRAVQSTGGLFD